MGVKSPRQYTLEFKRQAVQLAQELKSGPKAALQLGISASNIHTWKMQFRNESSRVGTPNSATPMSRPPESAEEELKRLRREMVELKKVNYILKQAAAFFSQDHLK